MNREEKLKILEDAENRCYEALRAVAPGKDMDVLMETISDICWRHEAITKEYDEHFAVRNPAVGAEDAPVEESVKLDPIEEPAPEPETPAITKQQMVTKLTAFQSGGVAIDEVMQSMGYAKLSQVPADRYWELLENCQKIADGEG